jgi:hypothetical protein
VADIKLDPDQDYVLESGAVWITVGSISVHVKKGDDGVGVTLYPLHREDDESLTETWATYAEAEDDDE